MGSMWYLGVIYFFYGLSYIIYMVFFAAYLVKDIGFTQKAAGELWALVGGLSIFCGVIWGLHIRPARKKQRSGFGLPFPRALIHHLCLDQG